MDLPLTLTMYILKDKGFIMRTYLAAILTLTFANALVVSAQARPACTVFRNVTVVDVVNGLLDANEDVIVRGDRIESVQQASSKTISTTADSCRSGCSVA